MYFIKTPALIKKAFPGIIWSILAKKKTIYLTFDDGPIPEVTPWVLNQLKNYGAKATFFCIGNNIAKHPQIFRQVIAEGHAIGNHTYHHLNGWRTKNEKYLDDIAKCEISIQNNSKSQTPNSKLFRPPYGRIRPSQYSMLHIQYSIIMWDVLSGDFDKNISKERCLKNVLKNAVNGSIIVFHDSIKAFPRLEYALPKVLEFFAEKSYVFSELSAV